MATELRRDSRKKNRYAKRSTAVLASFIISFLSMSITPACALGLPKVRTAKLGEGLFAAEMENSFSEKIMNRFRSGMKSFPKSGLGSGLGADITRIGAPLQTAKKWFNMNEIKKYTLSRSKKEKIRNALSAAVPEPATTMGLMPNFPMDPFYAPEKSPRHHNPKGKEPQQAPDAPIMPAGKIGAKVINRQNLY